MNEIGKATILILASTAAVLPYKGLKAQEGTAGARAVEEITVTARKREESMQEIPLSVSAITSEAIDRAGIQDLSGVADLTAGLVYQDYGGGGLGAPVIRGQAQTDIRSVNANVGIFLDGVFVSSRGNLEFQLFDVARVEVVKGPQSALYGNDTFAGAINYVTQRPTEELSGKLTGTIGNEERLDVAGSISGTIVDDTLRGRFAAGYSDFDGTVKNTLGENLGGWNDKYAVMGQLDFTPSDTFEARLFYYYGESGMDPTAGFIYTNNCGGINGAGGTPTGRGGSAHRYFCGDMDAPDAVTVRSDILYGNQATTSLGYVDMSWDIGRVTVTSLTSAGNYTSDALVDFYYNAPIGLPPESQQVIIPDFGGSNDWSQEIRLSSFGNEQLDWTAGVYLNNFEVDRQFAFGFPANPTAITNLLTVTESKLWAAFAGLTFFLNDRTTLNTEIRYSSDEREAVLENVNTGVVNVQDDTFDDLTYRVSLDYTLAQGSMIYASIAEGTKSGGFNNTPVPEEQTYDPETNLVYEFGWKSSLLDNRMTLNTSVFYSRWSDAQILAPSAEIGNPTVTKNVGNVTTYGGEADLRWALTAQWWVQAGYAYSDPTFDTPTIDIQHGRRCETPADCGLQPGPDGLGIDVSGQRVDRSFRHTGYLSSTYEWTLGQHEYYVRADGSFTGEQPQRSLNLQYIPARTVWNARIGMIRSNGLELSAWARNLFDEQYVYSAINQPEVALNSTFSTGHVANGLTYGVTATYRFGSR